MIEVFPQYYADSAKHAREKEILSRPVESWSEEDLLELSRPYDYSDIVFTTETYRGGSHHKKKTRNRFNPWGVVAGKHEGAQFYTLGQRKGLGIGGHKNPVFVIATDVQSNRVYVGEGEEHEGLYRKVMRLLPEDMHWMRPCYEMKAGEQRRVRVRIRYRQPLQDATVYYKNSGIYVVFDRSQRSITPGQFAAFHLCENEAPDAIDAEAPELIFSAVIA